MPKWRLTLAAEADYKAIGQYTQKQWGIEQRVAYLVALVNAFDALADNTDLGRNRDTLRQGLLSYPCGKHVIFFRRKEAEVQILRILHGRQSTTKAFP